MIKIFSLLLMSLFFWSSMHLHSMQDTSDSNNNARTLKQKMLSMGGIITSLLVAGKGIYDTYGFFQSYFRFKNMRQSLENISLEKFIVLSKSKEGDIFKFIPMLASLCKEVCIKPPELFIFVSNMVDLSSENLLGYKILRINAALTKWELPSLKAMLAHELMHIKNNDNIKGVIGGIIIPLLAIASVYGIPKIIDKYFIHKNGKDKESFWCQAKRYLENPLTRIVATPLISYYLKKLFREYMEIRADLGAASLCKSSRGLIEVFNRGKTPLGDTIANFLTGNHPNDKIRVAYLSLWQKLYDWKII